MGFSEDQIAAAMNENAKDTWFDPSVAIANLTAEEVTQLFPKLRKESQYGQTESTLEAASQTKKTAVALNKKEHDLIFKPEKRRENIKEKKAFIKNTTENLISVQNISKEEASHHARQLYDVVRVLAVNNNMPFQVVADMFGGFQEGQAVGENANVFNQDTIGEQKLKQDEANFSKAIDDFMQGALPKRETIHVMTTPLVLGLAGAKILPIGLKTKELKKILMDTRERDGHAGDMTPKIIKQVPRALTDPIMIFDSKTVQGRKVVLLDLVDNNKSHIVVPFELNTKADGYDMNIMTSAYGKDQEVIRDGKLVMEPEYGWFRTQLKEGNVAYINKTKATNFGKLSKLQLLISSFLNSSHVLNKTVLTEADLVKKKNQLGERVYQDKPSPRGERGAIRFEDGKYFIELFKHADASTVIHEVGHFAYLIRQQLATDGKLSLHDQKIMTELEAWSGMDKAVTENEQKAAHEKIAKGFEKWVAEGVAPSKGIAAFFEYMKNILLDLYRNHQDYFGDVELNPNVRNAFDRMLALEDEILLKKMADGADVLMELDAKEGSADRLLFNVTEDKINALNEDRADADIKAQDKLRRKANVDIEKRQNVLAERARELYDRLVYEPLFGQNTQDKLKSRYDKDLKKDVALLRKEAEAQYVELYHNAFWDMKDARGIRLNYNDAKYILGEGRAKDLLKKYPGRFVKDGGYRIDNWAAEMDRISALKQNPVAFLIF